jgi:hypothetical protein
MSSKAFEELLMTTVPTATRRLSSERAGGKSGLNVD